MENAKGTINKNQPPSVNQELGKLFSSTNGGARGQSRELGFGAGESSASATNASFTTPSTKWTIEEIWGSKGATSKKSRKSNKVTSGNVFHIVKEVFLIPDPSIKVVPKKKRQDHYINNLVASAVKFHSVIDEKNIRSEVGGRFPQYVTSFPEFDFLKAVENIFVQRYVKEWNFKL